MGRTKPPGSSGLRKHGVERGGCPGAANALEAAGNGIFASGKAYRLAYRCQRQSPYERAISQAFKRRRRLGADGSIGDPIDKPHGMRWATFDRKMDQVEAAEAVCDGRLLWFVQKLSQHG